MAHPAGESESFAVRLHSDRRLMLQFLAVALADVMASVRTRFWLAARPKKREYSRLLGVHLGNPGSVERLSEEGDETGGE
jgi:hypothetical protein